MLDGAPMGMIRKTITVSMYRCERCGYEWIPRGTVPPKVCANLKCKSPYWNKPRQRPVKKKPRSKPLRP